MPAAKKAFEHFADEECAQYARTYEAVAREDGATGGDLSARDEDQAAEEDAQSM